EGAADVGEGGDVRDADAVEARGGADRPQVVDRRWRAHGGPQVARSGRVRRRGRAGAAGAPPSRSAGRPVASPAGSTSPARNWGRMARSVPLGSCGWDPLVWAAGRAAVGRAAAGASAEDAVVADRGAVGVAGTTRTEGVVAL